MLRGVSNAALQAHPVLRLPTSSLEANDPFTLTSFALALLLAFRLDASYSRFMEGRGIWGNVVYDSRNLMCKVCINPPHSHRHTLALLAAQLLTIQPQLRSLFSMLRRKCTLMLIKQTIKATGTATPVIASKLPAGSHAEDMLVCDSDRLCMLRWAGGDCLMLCCAVLMQCFHVQLTRKPLVCKAKVDVLFRHRHMLMTSTACSYCCAGQAHSPDHSCGMCGRSVISKLK